MNVVLKNVISEMKNTIIARNVPSPYLNKETE